METTSGINGMESLPKKTLDFRQAMSDFQVMFPTLDIAVIETILRRNNGHVDATIDELLQLSQCTNNNRSNRQNRNHYNHRSSNHRRIRRLAPESYESTDSEDSIPPELLDPPTSSDEEFRDPPPMYTPRADEPFSFGDSPVEVETHSKYPPPSHKHNHYKAWNPPMLGKLPDDFLRILPQQFETTPPLYHQNNSNSSRHKQKSTRHKHRVLHPPQEVPPTPLPRPSTPVKEHMLTHANSVDASPPIPPREPNIEPGNLFIKPISHRDFCLKSSQSSTHARSNSYREPQSHHRHSHAMVRSQTSVTPLTHQHHHNKYNNTRRNSSGSNRRMVMVQPSHNFIPSSSSTSSSSYRSHQRSPADEDQYIEDKKLALMLQNEEFVKELQMNEDFLRSLEKDNKKSKNNPPTSPSINEQNIFNSEQSNEFIAMPDPDAKYPIGAKKASVIRKAGISKNDQDKVFKENVQHMGKCDQSS